MLITNTWRIFGTYDGRGSGAVAETEAVESCSAPPDACAGVSQTARPSTETAATPGGGRTPNAGPGGRAGGGGGAGAGDDAGSREVPALGGELDLQRGPLPEL